MSFNTPREKRQRATATPTSQHRAKREKYTASACNECKRRKVKCSGGAVCQRCTSFGIECIYLLSDEIVHRGPDKFRELSAKIDGLQRQVDTLFAHIQTLSGVSSPSALKFMGTGPSSHTTRTPAYLGPTSAEYGIGIAKSTLEDEGLQIQSSQDQGHDDESETSQSSASTRCGTPTSVAHAMAPRGLITALGKEEVLKLIEAYRGASGAVYPCVDIDGIRNYAVQFFHSQRTIGEDYRQSEAFAEFDRDFEILKIIISISLVFEGRGQHSIGEQLMDGVGDTMGLRFKVYEVDTKELLIFFLMSLYHFYTGEEILAYRFTGIAIRGSIEMGLHRRSTWLRTSGIFPGELQRSWALKLFWCIYIADRRWSIGTGMPFALQDSDIDTEMPETDESNGYLISMIFYGRLAAKVWKAVASCGECNQKLSGDEIAYLDFQIEQWAKSIPSELHLPQSPLQKSADPSTRLLQYHNHLGASQMRILVHRQSLLTKDSMRRDSSSAQLVVNLAKDTIEVIDQMNSTSNMYRVHQSAFNYFLVSALSTLFLAVCHDPEKWRETCQDSLAIALGLIKELSSKSFTARRLWKTIRHLKHAGSHLGLHSGRRSRRKSRKTPVDRLSKKITGGVVANQVSDLDVNAISTSAWNWPEDSYQISSELSNIFRAAGGENGAGSSSGSWQISGIGGNGDTLMDFSGFADDDEFSRAMMELL